tara:strand:- start:130 stop:1167 length:1038 start_codon:yes stop_codon:yes gene_type:complete
MINTRDIKDILSVDTVRKLINDEQIFRYYIEYDFNVGDVFTSPLRKDTNPSFGIYYNTHIGKLMYNDYNSTGGDVFIFVKEFYKLHSITEALKVINHDLQLGLTEHYKKGAYKPTTTITKDVSKLRITPNIKIKKVLQVEVQPFTTQDILYWSNFCISKKTLQYFNVHSVKKLYRNRVLNRAYTTKSPIFGYIFKSGHIKTYRPLESNIKEKWRSNCNNIEDLQGFDQLPERGERLIITKSLKDVMTLYGMGIPAIAPHGEGQHIPEETLENLKKRFPFIITFFDNDTAGIKYTAKFLEKYKINGFCIPREWEVKDISEFVEHYSLAEGKKFIENATTIKKKDYL